ncbi:Saccharopine dehydrogenase-like oxidoreductase [Hondaea fermentalgiana]|uniref:Saccharopine dehydrogenase-like oxidoreductase n=1 Tax=Hondaea fermentalgiana TaxID=2315210 RepID=A0A2R5GRA7_9STRA|nr:Saccharopine dehydrogenase-like oxidoreductase [Hondaea fermentalgiana]|eukprot:GBG33380.1 Saccharopine dehydrogenase-like oxidoreductase [Hondaea fermentalgiana]
MAQRAARELDVVVWGATGFTGQLAAAYLATVARTAGVRWAIGGRNEGKLRKIVADLEAGKDTESLPEVIVCSIDDTKGLHAMAARTRVIASLAGPFSQMGTPILEACIAERCDYCDITGEVPWVKIQSDRLGPAAEANGVILSSCCGFDSLPSDLGTLYAVTKLREKFGPNVRIGKVTAYFDMMGSLSGGTLASGIAMENDPELHKMNQNPFLLGGAPEGGPRPDDADYKNYEQDPELGTWIAPFGMAMINTRIVRKSGTALQYGPDFQYREVAVAPSEKAAAKMAKPLPPASKRQAMVEAGRLPKQGDGPSKELRAKSWFRTRIKAEDATDPSRYVWVQVSGGDPGYTETAKMLSEAAICLAQQREVLPRTAGFLTPASSMGTALIERLQAAGIRFEAIPSPASSSSSKL